MLKPHIKQIRPGMWECRLPVSFLGFGVWHYLTIAQYGETPAEAFHTWKLAKARGEEAVRGQCNKVAESYKLSHGAPFVVSPAPALPEVENHFIPKFIITAWRRFKG